jgi:hypothetical protein
MILKKYTAEIDEISYDRQRLLNFSKKFSDCIIPFHEYKKVKEESNKLHGFNIVNASLLEGKNLIDYEEIHEIIDLFNFEFPLGPEEVDIIHYDIGFSFPPHTDPYMKAGIMFPILPDNGGSPISFYEKEGISVEPRKDYTNLISEKDILYTHHYSTVHPTLFSSYSIHSVDKTTQERVYLKLKICKETFEDLVQKHQKGLLLKH